MASSNAFTTMKNVLLIAAASVLMVSCAKEYNCNCESENLTETNQLIFKTNSKSHANRLCDDYASRVRNAEIDRDDYNCTLD